MGRPLPSFCGMKKKLALTSFQTSKALTRGRPAIGAAVAARDGA